MKALLTTICFLGLLASKAQFAYTAAPKKPVYVYTPEQYFNSYLTQPKRKTLYQRNVGMILGLQKGKFTAIELGGEAHWRKISVLRKPHIIGATANMEYTFSNHIIGYKAGMWMKRGRINLTYGANVSYFNDFQDGHRFGFGPSVGFRLLGLHLVNGYNFLSKDKKKKTDDPMEVNSLYMSLRYYFPVENKFTWDRQTMKRKRERRKDKEQKKRDRQKARENGEKQGIGKWFDSIIHKKK